MVLPVTVMGQVRGNPKGLNQPLFFTVIYIYNFFYILVLHDLLCGHCCFDFMAKIHKNYATVLLQLWTLYTNSEDYNELLHDIAGDT